MTTTPYFIKQIGYYCYPKDNSTTYYNNHILSKFLKLIPISNSSLYSYELQFSKSKDC